MSVKDLGLVTAYGYAKEGGYTGTEVQFKELLANVAIDLAEIENLSVTVTTLSAGSDATASYDSGVLSLGIPRGDTGEVSEDELEETLESYAMVDGYYSNLTAGSAEQLLSTVTIEDEVPYQFRTSGGSVDIGDRETDMLVGGTVAWNQLIEHGNFDSTTGWQTSRGTITVANNKGTYTVTEKNAGNGIYRNHIYVKDHIYFAGATLTPSKNTTSGFFFGGSVAVGMKSITANIANRVETIAKAVADTYGSCYVYCNRGLALEANDTCIYENVNVIDLTQMFGSTIADYIYSLEQANAGAGVAFFRKLFPKPYYAYNAGELLSVSGVSAHNMTGFNQWDEEWEVGYLDAQGAEASSTNNIRSKFFDLCIGGVTYCIYNGTSTSIKFYEYDADKNYVDNWSCNTGSSRIVTTSGNTRYFKICTSAGVTTYNHDICINLSWDGERDGEYEPYVKHSYPLDDSLTLRGMPKLDSSNNLYYDGDTYESDGTVTRKYGIVTFDGSESWSANSANTGLYYVTVSDIKSSGKGISDRFLQTSASGADMVDGQMKIVSHNLNFKTPYETVQEWKTALVSKNLTVVYELATPTTETADPYTNPQIVDDFGTEEYVTTSIVPVGHKTQYMPNLRAKLEMAPNSPNGNGDYIVRQTNGMNEYVPLVIEDALPTIPSTAGSYKLTVTVTEGADPVLSWEAE